METQKITAAAIFSKSTVQVKIWFTEPPQQQSEIEKWNEWLDTGKNYQFKDDLQAGKFMWLASHEFQQAYTHGHTYRAATKKGIRLPVGKSYFDCLTESGVFVMEEHLGLIGFEGDKIYMRALQQPPKEIKIELQAQAITPEERLADISRKHNVQKTISVTGKTLWKYAWIGATIGATIGVLLGVSCGLVLGAVYF